MNAEKTQAIWFGHRDKEKQALLDEFRLQATDTFTLLGIKFSLKLSDMYVLNYDQKLIEINNVLKSYSKRKLSLMGKVTVVKTLALPKLTHVMSVLPSPPKSFYQELQKILSKFIWNGGRPKIKSSQLAQRYEDGGLKLTDVETFNQALKISWVQRFINSNADWQKLARSIFKIYNPDLIWELDPISLKQIGSTVKSLFWKDVMSAWQDYITLQRTNSPEETLSQPLWNTHFMKAPNILNLQQLLTQKYCVRVGDLIDPNTGTFYTLENFNAKFKVTLNFMDYACLTKSIPSIWILRLKQNKPDTEKVGEQIYVSKIKNTLKTTNFAYWEIIGKRVETPNSSGESS